MNLLFLSTLVMDCFLFSMSADLAQPDTSRNTGIPGLPPGFRLDFDPATGRFFPVVDSTAEKETEKEQIKEKAKVDLSLLTPPTITVVNQLPKGFHQVFDVQTGRYVLAVDATAEKTEKDQKTDGTMVLRFLAKSQLS